MKKTILATILVAASSSLCFAQDAARPKPPAGGPGAPPPPAGAPAPSQPATTVSGNVLGLSYNHDFVYDGFWMKAQNDSLLVKFPPHLGKPVVALANVGSTVSVTGTTGPDGKTMRLSSLTSNGKTVTNEAPAQNGTTPPTESSVSGSGKIASVQNGGKGEITGVILDNGTLLRFRPKAAALADVSLGSGATLSYTGLRHQRSGLEAVAKDYQVVHCQTLTINGKSITF